MAKLSVFNRPRPPRSVNICGHKIKVKVVAYLVDDQDNELEGAYNGETKTIFLTKGCDWKSVLWHESIHCCWHLTGASLGISEKREESLVLAAEYGLCSLFF